jgi:hypothetical protein
LATEPIAHSRSFGGTGCFAPAFPAQLPWRPLEGRYRFWISFELSGTCR